MTAPFLKTKLNIPPVRPEQVKRPHLLEQLNAGVGLTGNFTQKLTLISAPAGFGKTTLLSDWVAKQGYATTWISLDEGDSDPIRFLTYLLSAIQSVDAVFGEDLLLALKSARAVNVEMALTTIINELADMQKRVAIVLDDYHLIESRKVDEAVAYLIEHLPSNVHLIIATRSDPNIQLARLRGRGQINELRTKDLRFTSDEAQKFVTHALEQKINKAQVDALNSRTEGWIAGLQMAVLSLRGVENVADFISTFAGDHRYVVDYLVDEVLSRCTDETRDFLLKTSILDRLSASICNVLSGRADGQKSLEKLEQDNIFLIPLDQRREWWRYHHLFADLLRHRLSIIYPDQLDDLHERASRWLSDHGFTDQAIYHALQMQDKNLAAELLEINTNILLFKGRLASRNLGEWYAQLPDSIMQERPILRVLSIWVHIFNSPFDLPAEIKATLAELKKTAQVLPEDNKAKFIVLGHIASIHAYLSHPPVQTEYDSETVLNLYDKAEKLFPESEIYIRSSNFIGVAYEYMNLEEIEPAVKANDNAFKYARMGDNLLVATIAKRNLALIAYYMGEIETAIQICIKTIKLFETSPNETMRSFPGISILNVTLGFLYTERTEFELAEAAIDKAYGRLKWFGEYEALVLCAIAVSRIYTIKGQPDRALKIFEEFEMQWPSLISVTLTLKTQVNLLTIQDNHGDWEDISEWLEVHCPDISTDNDRMGISPWAETQHISHLTRIQSQIYLYRINARTQNGVSLPICLQYLENKLKGAGDRNIKFRVMEYLVLKSLILETTGLRKKALTDLRQAIELAKSQGYRRIFLDKGQLMIRLLSELQDDQNNGDFVKQLLKVVDGESGYSIPTIQQGLIEPLTTRELEVLVLIAKGYTNSEIGNRLFLAINTVKGHNRNIFGKLGVRNRTQAVVKARSLQLLPP